MAFEALDVMTSLWTQGPTNFEGEFWSTCKPETTFDTLGFHLRPFQYPYPPVAIAGLTPGSENHRLAGEKGYIPVSLSISPDVTVTAKHWDAVVEGAARSGRTPNRDDWRIIRDVYVAPTDQEARDLAINGIMGRCWREFLLPLYLRLGLGNLLKLDPTMPDDAVDLDYLADHLWFIGSPSTVTERIRQLQEETGGFGRLLVVSYDGTDERELWERSLRLLMEEVLPGCVMEGCSLGDR
jgi:alkanesulfonate monooxygenase SsuD/methylene tetrahydromethanopterin reductase-like flavin-dependent oxidoreductase (luciferase family)